MYLKWSFWDDSYLFDNLLYTGISMLPYLYLSDFRQYFFWISLITGKFSYFDGISLNIFSIFSILILGAILNMTLLHSSIDIFCSCISFKYLKPSKFKSTFLLTKSLYSLLLLQYNCKFDNPFCFKLNASSDTQIISYFNELVSIS